MPDILLRVLLALSIPALYVGIVRIVRRDGSLSLAEVHASAFTFSIWWWTALMMALGFAGLATLPFLALGGVAAAVALWLVAPLPRRATWRILIDRASLLPPWALLFIVPAGLSLLVNARHAILSIPVDYDGLSYHMGTALHVYQDGDFRLYEGESGYTNYFSRGVELLAALLMHVFRDIRVLNTVQLLVLPPICLCLYAAARALGAGRGWAVVAGCWPLSVPVIMTQAAMTYVDLTSVGWLTVGGCIVLSSRGSRQPGAVRMLCMFAACGLAVAAKFNAATGCVVVGVAALALWGWRVFFTEAGLKVAMIGFMMAAAVGLAWPVRNWILVGSPIYPFALQVAGITLAPGPIPMEHTRLMPETPPAGYTPEEWLAMPLPPKLWMSWTWLDFESWKRYGPLGFSMMEAPLSELNDGSFGYRGENKLGGLGLSWLFPLLPAFVVYTGFAIYGMRRCGRRKIARYQLVAALLPLGIFIVTIAPWWARFSLFLPLFAALGLAVLLGYWSRRNIRVAPIAMTVLAIPFLIDLMVVVLFNRDRELQHRFRLESVNHRPIDFFLWQNPGDPRDRAISAMLSAAVPGESVSFHTPNDPVFTGLFTDTSGSIRLFPLPTVFPPPESFTLEQQLAWIEREHVALILIGPTSGTEFAGMLRQRGARLHAQFGDWRVYRLPHGER